MQRMNIVGEPAESSMSLVSECMPQLASLFSNGSMQYDATVPADLFSDGSSCLLSESSLSPNMASLSANTPLDLGPGLLDTDNAFPILNLDEESLLSGITSDDMSSLLEQFENVAEKLPETEPHMSKTYSSPNIVRGVVANPEPKKALAPEDSEVMKLLKTSQPSRRLTASAPTTPATSPPPEVLQKISSGTKRKSAIMLANVVPTRTEQKARPVELQGRFTPNRRLQRANSNYETASSATSSSLSPIKSPATQTQSQLMQTLIGSPPPEPRVPVAIQVDDQYFKNIADHDYACNAPPVRFKTDGSASKKASRLSFGKQFVLKRGNSVVMSTHHLKPQSLRTDSPEQNAIDDSMLKSLLLNNKLVEEMRRGTGVEKQPGWGSGSSSSPSPVPLVLPPLPYSQNITSESQYDGIGKFIPNPFVVNSVSPVPRESNQSPADRTLPLFIKQEVKLEVKEEPRSPEYMSGDDEHSTEAMSAGDDNVSNQTELQFCDNMKQEPMDISDTDGEHGQILVIKQEQMDSDDEEDNDIENNRFSKFFNERNKPLIEVSEKQGGQDNTISLKSTRFSRRIYRKKHAAEEDTSDDAMYHDKLPSHYTVLCKPTKLKPLQERSDPVSRIMSSANVIRQHDRDPSPDRNDPTFNKLPSYFNCFTNSTKYDGNGPKYEENFVNKASSLPLPPGACRADPLGLNSAPVSRENSPSKQTLPNVKNSSSASCPGSRSGSPVPRNRSLSTSTQKTLRTAMARRRNCSRTSCHSRSSRSSSSSSRSSRSRSRSRSHYRSRHRYTRSQRSRARSRRNRGSYSSTRSSSRSRSRSRSPIRSRSRSRRSSRMRSPCGRLSKRTRTRSAEKRMEEERMHYEEVKKREKEERRILYVGNIKKGITRRQLREEFSQFGEVIDVSVHFRDNGNGDNYGFVTFALTCDAFHALEAGKRKKDMEHYDLCFGGRREFCGASYQDLDGNAEMEEEMGLSMNNNSKTLDFDQLLKAAQKKSRR